MCISLPLRSSIGTYILSCYLLSTWGEAKSGVVARGFWGGMDTCLNLTSRRHMQPPWAASIYALRQCCNLHLAAFWWGDVSNSNASTGNEPARKTQPTAVVSLPISNASKGKQAHQQHIRSYCSILQCQNAMSHLAEGASPRHNKQQYSWCLANRHGLNGQRSLLPKGSVSTGKGVYCQSTIVHRQHTSKVVNTWQ